MRINDFLRMAFLLTILPPLKVMGDVTLDKLSDCQELTAVHTLVSAPISSSCRSPRNALEVKLMAQFAFMPRGKACLLPSAPTTRLSGFTCVQTFNSGDGELACFRITDKRSVDEYFQNYQSHYRDRALAYQNAADQCDVGNGDATPAKPELFPAIFNGVGKPRIGFVLGIGKGVTTRSRAYHGFAELDPELATSTTTDLEVFEMFQVSSSAANSPSPTKLQNAGILQLEINDEQQTAEDFEKLMAEKAQMPVVAQFRFIFLKYVGGSERSSTKKQNDLERWQRGMAAIARDSGFRRFTQAELSKTPLRSQDEMRDYMVHHSPFGTRGTIQGQMGRHIDFLRRGDNDDDCGQVVEILSMLPVDGVKEDYGAFGIMSFAIGCDDEDTRRDLRKVLEAMTQVLAAKGNEQ